MLVLTLIHWMLRSVRICTSCLLFPVPIDQSFMLIISNIRFYLSIRHHFCFFSCNSYHRQTNAHIIFISFLVIQFPPFSFTECKIFTYFSTLFFCSVCILMSAFICQSQPNRFRWSDCKLKSKVKAGFYIVEHIFIDIDYVNWVVIAHPIHASITWEKEKDWDTHTWNVCRIPT